MATGRLGAASPASDTDTILYTCPASKTASVTVSIARRGDGTELIRLALMDDATIGNLSNEDYIEYGSNITEYAGIVLSAGQSLVVRANAATVSFVAFGFEEAA